MGEESREGRAETLLFAACSGGKRAMDGLAQVAGRKHETFFAKSVKMRGIPARTFENGPCSDGPTTANGRTARIGSEGHKRQGVAEVVPKKRRR